ncbi:hypothetical protein [Bradyrhizobium sp. CCBAU 11386]|uniref:hypothetical protein n=1 Tax=Bradyrhizobium sp. CCBAU 11386 TaxID=1630837 RepID=UPI00230376E6|nr:hypothetical protein [Bradyrhizobium sp. CCBAU 11386]
MMQRPPSFARVSPPVRPSIRRIGKHPRAIWILTRRNDLPRQHAYYAIMEALGSGRSPQHRQSIACKAH